MARGSSYGTAEDILYGQLSRTSPTLEHFSAKRLHDLDPDRLLDEGSWIEDLEGRGYSGTTDWLARSPRLPGFITDAWRKKTEEMGETGRFVWTSFLDDLEHLENLSDHVHEISYSENDADTTTLELDVDGQEMLTTIDTQVMHAVEDISGGSGEWMRIDKFTIDGVERHWDHVLLYLAIDGQLLGCFWPVAIDQTD